MRVGWIEDYSKYSEEKNTKTIIFIVLCAIYNTNFAFDKHFVYINKLKQLRKTISGFEAKEIS